SVLEEVNASLETEAQQYRDEIETLTEVVQAVEAENEELKDENKKLKYEKQQFTTWRGEQEATISQLREGLETISTLNRLPNSVIAAAEIIEKLHPTTIEFTALGKQSAKTTAFTDTDVAWRILWAIATTLNELYFNTPDDRIDITKRFKELT